MARQQWSDQLASPSFLPGLVLGGISALQQLKSSRSDIMICIIGLDAVTVQVIERLTERRIVVEKAVSTLGEAPTGLRDVFELCRGFEKAFSNIVNVSV